MSFPGFSEASAKTNAKILTIHIIIIWLLSRQHGIKQFTLDGFSLDFISLKLTEMSG
jgi:hypothetical protein